MKIRVLLVDDSPVFLSALKHLLHLLADVEVVGEAHDGRDALVKADALEPDLMLLDIVMAKMGGLEVARLMQSWARAPQIIFLSMHQNAAYRSAARELGTLGLVGKSELVSELIPMIARLTDEEMLHKVGGCA